MRLRRRRHAAGRTNAGETANVPPIPHTQTSVVAPDPGEVPPLATTPPKPPTSPAETSPATVVTTRLELPYRTIARVVLSLALLWLLGRLWTLLLLLFIALLLAAALDPVVARLQRRG